MPNNTQSSQLISPAISFNGYDAEYWEFTNYDKVHSVYVEKSAPKTATIFTESILYESSETDNLLGNPFLETTQREDLKHIDMHQYIPTAKEKRHYHFNYEYDLTHAQLTSLAHILKNETSPSVIMPQKGKIASTSHNSSPMMPPTPFQNISNQSPNENTRKFLETAMGL